MLGQLGNEFQQVLLGPIAGDFEFGTEAVQNTVQGLDPVELLPDERSDFVQGVNPISFGGKKEGFAAELAFTEGIVFNRDCLQIDHDLPFFGGKIPLDDLQDRRGSSKVEKTAAEGSRHGLGLQAKTLSLHFAPILVRLGDDYHHLDASHKQAGADAGFAGLISPSLIVG